MYSIIALCVHCPIYKIEHIYYIRAYRYVTVTDPILTIFKKSENIYMKLDFSKALYFFTS